MCVIAIVNKVRPTPEQVERMFKANDHGGGVAWREKGVVKWKKGLDLAQMQELIATLPLTTFIAHFRIASSGAQIKALCHPFPIEAKVDLALEGETKGYVLFHNGHWANWKDFSQQTALRMAKPIPLGSWSDTRALAWAAHNYGLGILEMIDEKVVAFGPNDLEVSRGKDGWDDVGGIWCSNKSWNWGYRGAKGFFSDTTRQDTNDVNEFYHSQIPASLAGNDTQCNWSLNNTRCAFKIAHAGKHSYEIECCDVTLNGKLRCKLVKGHTGGHTYLEATRGGLDELPFDLIEQMWKDQLNLPRSEWKISKKQFKRLKRKYEARLRKLGISTKEGAKTVPITVH